MIDPFSKQRAEYHSKNKKDSEVDNKLKKLLEAFVFSSIGDLKGKDGYTPVFGLSLIHISEPTRPY